MEKIVPQKDKIDLYPLFFSLMVFINSVGNIPNCFWKHFVK